MCQMCTGNGDTQRSRVVYLLHRGDSVLEGPGLSSTLVERVREDHTGSHHCLGPSVKTAQPKSKCMKPGEL